MKLSKTIIWIILRKMKKVKQLSGTYSNLYLDAKELFEYDLWKWKINKYSCRNSL